MPKKSRIRVSRYFNKGEMRKLKFDTNTILAKDKRINTLVEELASLCQGKPQGEVIAALDKLRELIYV